MLKRPFVSIVKSFALNQTHLKSLNKSSKLVGDEMNSKLLKVTWCKIYLQ